MNDLSGFIDSTPVFFIVMAVSVIAGLLSVIYLRKVVKSVRTDADLRGFINPADVVLYPSRLNQEGIRARRKFFLCASLALVLPWLYVGLGTVLRQ